MGFDIAKGGNCGHCHGAILFDTGVGRKRETVQLLLLRNLQLPFVRVTALLSLRRGWHGRRPTFTFGPMLGPMSGLLALRIISPLRRRLRIISGGISGVISGATCQE